MFQHSLIVDFLVLTAIFQVVSFVWFLLTAVRKRSASGFAIDKSSPAFRGVEALALLAGGQLTIAVPMEFRDILMHLGMIDGPTTIEYASPFIAIGTFLMIWGLVIAHYAFFPRRLHHKWWLTPLMISVAISVAIISVVAWVSER